MSYAPPPPRIATMREAAEFLRLSDTSIRRMVKAGKLKPFKIGSSTRFWLSDLEALGATR